MNKSQLIARVTELAKRAEVETPNVDNLSNREIQEIIESLELSVDVTTEDDPVVPAPSVPVPVSVATSHTHKLAPGVAMNTPRGVLIEEAGLSVADFSGGADALAVHVKAGKVVPS